MLAELSLDTVFFNDDFRFSVNEEDIFITGHLHGRPFTGNTPQYQIGDVWTYEYTHYFINGDSEVRPYHWTITGDTLISDTLAWVVECDVEPTFSYVLYAGDGKIFFYEPELGHFYRHYDYDLSAGDSYRVPYYAIGGAELSDTATVIIDSTDHLRLPSGDSLFRQYISVIDNGSLGSAEPGALYKATNKCWVA